MELFTTIISSSTGGVDSYMANLPLPEVDLFGVNLFIILARDIGSFFIVANEVIGALEEEQSPILKAIDIFCFLVAWSSLMFSSTLIESTALFQALSGQPHTIEVVFSKESKAIINLSFQPNLSFVFYSFMILAFLATNP